MIPLVTHKLTPDFRAPHQHLRSRRDISVQDPEMTDATAADDTAEPQDLKARLKESYDAIAVEYNAWTVDHSPKRMAYLTKLLDLMLAGGGDGDGDGDNDTSKELSFLELGCGAGVPVTQHLLATLPRARVTANDLSSEQVRLGKAHIGAAGEGAGDRVTWLEGDMMALSFPARSFDAVLGFYSIIHLPRAEQEALLGRVAGWLRPGGYLLANFPAGEMRGAVDESWLGQEKGWMYWSGFGAEETMRKIEGLGMGVVADETLEDEEGAKFLWVIGRKAAE